MEEPGSFGFSMSLCCCGQDSDRHSWPGGAWPAWFRRSGEQLRHHAACPPGLSSETRPCPSSIPASPTTGPTAPRQRETACENRMGPWAGRSGTWAQASIPPPAGFLGHALLVQEARESEERPLSPLPHPEVMCSLGKEIESLGWACTCCSI